MKSLLGRVKNKIIYLLRGVPCDHINWDHKKSIKEVLVALRKRGYNFDCVIDIGASDGRWSRISLSQYPKAVHILLEPNKSHFSGIKKFLSEFPTSHHLASAAGQKTGNINFCFDPSNPFGGVASDGTSGDIVSCVSVSDVIRNHSIKGSVLLKLDTHGYEIPILEGIEDTYSCIDAIIVECYTHILIPGSKLFWEICSYMDQKGYCCIDCADPIFRSSDNTLWQIDLLFVKKEQDECRNNKYM
jgi:FkbM family methyltransferase